MKIKYLAVIIAVCVLATQYVCAQETNNVAVTPVITTTNSPLNISGSLYSTNKVGDDIDMLWRKAKESEKEPCLNLPFMDKLHYKSFDYYAAGKFSRDSAQIPFFEIGQKLQACVSYDAFTPTSSTGPWSDVTIIGIVLCWPR